MHARGWEATESEGTVPARPWPAGSRQVGSRRRSAPLCSAGWPGLVLASGERGREIPTRLPGLSLRPSPPPAPQPRGPRFVTSGGELGFSVPLAQFGLP